MKCESCGHENLEEARFCASCGAMLPVAGAHEHPWVGRLIGGRFRVTSVLGEGGMGVVYSGEQQMGSTVRRVAIKTLHPHLSHDPSVLARFHRECGTVAQLEHPNTIKVYDFGAEEDGTLYIAMEFVDGRSLDRVIEEEGALDPQRVTRIVEQVCGALDEAHAQGIIHRDLKPENIILSERLGKKDFVKVLDFGIASRSESADASKEQKLTQQGMVLGTPPYMSPEQFTGQALDRRSDIYSLGIMTYQMLTGRLPFSAATAWQWATEHMTAQPFPLEQTHVGSNVPESMRQAVMRALAKLSTDRQETAGAFFLELASASDGVRTSELGAQRMSTGTEAMPAAPALGGGGTAPLAAVPVGSAPVGGAATPGALAAPPPPVRPPQGGGGKGLVLGLGVFGVGLLVAIGVVAMSGGGDDSPPLPLLADNTAQPATVEPGTGEVKPDVSPDELPGDPPESDTTPVSTSQPSSPQPTASKPSPSPPAGSTGGTSGTSPTPTATSTAPGPTATTPPVTTPPPSKNDCSACISSARAGNLQGAAGALASCDAAGQANCRAEIERQAVSRGTAAANAKRCDEARAIAAAARAAGSTRLGRLDQAISKNCS